MATFHCRPALFIGFCQGPFNGSSGGWSHDQLPRMVIGVKLSSCPVGSQICLNYVLMYSKNKKNLEMRKIFYFVSWQWEFFSVKKTTPNNMISTHLESQQKELWWSYHGKIDKLCSCLSLLLSFCSNVLHMFQHLWCDIHIDFAIMGVITKLWSYCKLKETNWSLILS